MCGFTGMALSDPRGRIDLDRLRAMTRTLEHRGPDDEGLHEMAGVGLGFRRLSIIDLSGGNSITIDGITANSLAVGDFTIV